jgi:hypothetical protein
MQNWVPVRKERSTTSLDVLETSQTDSEYTRIQDMTDVEALNDFKRKNAGTSISLLYFGSTLLQKFAVEDITLNTVSIHAARGSLYLSANYSTLPVSIDQALLIIAAYQFVQRWRRLMDDFEVEINSPIATARRDGAGFLSAACIEMREHNILVYLSDKQKPNQSNEFRIVIEEPKNGSCPPLKFALSID